MVWQINCADYIVIIMVHDCSHVSEVQSACELRSIHIIPMFAVTEGYVGAAESEPSPVSSEAISHSLEARHWQTTFEGRIRIRRLTGCCQMYSYRHWQYRCNWFCKNLVILTHIMLFSLLVGGGATQLTRFLQVTRSSGPLHISFELIAVHPFISSNHCLAGLPRDPFIYIVQPLSC